MPILRKIIVVVVYVVEILVIWAFFYALDHPTDFEPDIPDRKGENENEQE